jgi:acyl-CoA hydrolase
MTVSRNCSDYVVTEYGVARLRGKTLRRKAEELIAISHPNFRAKLRREAQKLSGLDS